MAERTHAGTVKNRIKNGDTAFNIVNFTVFGIFTLICVFPFYYMFINTISNNEQSSLGNVLFLPVGVHLKNYVDVFQIKGLGEAALVSVYRTVAGTILTVFSSALLGYVFTKNEMWKRKLLYRFVVVTMYFNAGIIPWFFVMMTLKLTNNYLAYIIPSIVSPFNIILVKTFVESLPPSLEESAMLDGAGYFTILTRIIMPLVMPILATITIFCAVGQWNSFTDTLFLMSQARYYTLQFVLYRYINEASSLATLIKNTSGGMANMDISNLQTPTSVRMTVSMIVILPIIAVYPIFQRFFVKGIMIGAVKG